jgi:hypothetical protein
MLKLHQLTGIGLLATAVLTLTACSKQQNSESKPVSSPDSPDSYTPKIGLGVKTAARACFAIHNGDLTTGTAVTLVFPLAPVTIVQGTVSNVSKEPCPISQNVDTTVSNYSLDIKSPIPNLTPFIVVLGTPAVTVNANNVAQGDLNQNGQTQTFRACSADNGIHLTVWSGAPLQGKLLWHGPYYESSNPHIGPSCTPAEVPAQ